MMQHYLETKQQYPDCILFYRLGDFYEMFFEDAELASRELELTLTGKDCGLEERAPMCGVPYHAVDTYLNRLVQKGYKVAIAEQMEDPKLAKGLVKREVIRVVTPGTILSGQVLDETRNNYIMSIVMMENSFGIAVSDVTTGEFQVTEVETLRALQDEITKFTPAEILCNDAFCMSGLDFDDLKARMHTSVTALEPRYFREDCYINALTEHFHVKNTDELGLADFPTGAVAAGALMQYLNETQMTSLAHLSELRTYRTGKYMILDTSTRRNLELLETLREKNKRGSLLWVLDKTKTAMGARLLRTWIEQPLLDREEILKRQDAIEALNSSYITREELREYMGPIYDLERLTGRITYQSANPRDVVAFGHSIAMLPPIRRQLEEFGSGMLKEIHDELDCLEDLCSLTQSAIVDDPPAGMHDGGIIREGFSEEVDTLRRAKTDGKTWIADLEQKERESTGIKNLRVKYNKVFGYYLEVTNSFKDLVPDRYIRKQTLTGSERYTTPELKELEDVILNAEDKLYVLEYSLFCDVRDQIAAEVVRIQKSARAIAKLDVLVSLSVTAEQNDYVRPSINEKGIIDIRDGRHPVVEQMMKDDRFIANDTYLDNGQNRISIITGPNMAGKSTYMRQTALITLMAQIGSFVPASSADIGICDRIFTRVGASDDLASGQSTFMVEMTEVANILRNATRNSLLILDEIGRGTSTFDGLSIAWAVIEYISNTRILGAKTLFATHYHELTELEGKLPGVNNYCVAVKEIGDDIVFLRKIVRGGADRSYGIQVAKLAGIPQEVTDRARELADELSDADIASRASVESQSKGSSSRRRSRKQQEDEPVQLSLFDEQKQGSDITEEIRKMDLSSMTPIDALNLLYRWQSELKKD